MYTQRDDRRRRRQQHVRFDCCSHLALTASQRRTINVNCTVHNRSFIASLGPFYGAIAVPSVTRCRCCRGPILHCHSPGVATVARRLRYSYSWLRLILVVVSTVATPGEWQCKIRTGGVRRLAVANGPNIFQMLLVCKCITCTICDVPLAVRLFGENNAMPMPYISQRRARAHRSGVDVNATLRD